MTSPAVEAAHRVYAGEGDKKSSEARLLFDDLLAVAPALRRGFMSSLAERDLVEVMRVASLEGGTPFALWQDDPSGFVTDVLHESTWSKQSEVLDAIPGNKRVAVPSAFGTGKCMEEHERLPLADGRMPTAGDLVGTGFEVLAWREDGTQVRRRARAEWNAVEPVYRVRTSGGREIVRNAAHPLWTAKATSAVEGGRARGTVTLTPQVRGWTAVGALAVGDLALVPEQHHAQGQARRDRDHVVLLGYLLGDGGTGDRQITFTQRDGAGLDEFTAICDRLDVDLVPKAGRPFCYRLRGRLQAGEHPRLRRRTNRVLALAQEWGLFGVLSPAKRFPAWAWTLPNDQLAVLLGRLLSCDGWAYAREHNGRLTAQVAICLASEGLIRDVEHAMLRLGIVGTVRHRRIRYDGGHRDAWEWCCADRQALLLLAEIIDVPGKEAAVQRVADAVAGRTARRRAWPHRNAPAGYRWERVTSIDALPDARTVAVEVEGESTFVTSFVEHNTHIAARAVVWQGCVYPPGTALTVTTATRFRQVQRQLWPHIRALASKAHLPGTVDMTQWKMPAGGIETVVAYGFSAPPHDEAAVQGIHAPRLFIVIDEAGGIGRIIGDAMRGLLTGDATRMLAIGNPPTDDEGSWFEALCLAPDVRTIPISAYDTPQLSGEVTGVCRACPPTAPEHPLSTHLVDAAWVADALRDHGEDSPYVVAKVNARFPKGGPSRAIPIQWVEAAVEAPEPDVEAEGGYVRLSDLGLPDEQQSWVVRRGAWVRLGVDVAADGGDEFSIARSIGDLVTIEHTSSGAANTNPVDVAGVVLRQIRRAQALAAALGTEARVRVKIDAIGVGWGVAGTLEAWGSEGMHNAEIVRVVVSEAVGRDDEAATFRPVNKRAEMWLAGRSVLVPTGPGEPGALRLRVDRRCVAQLGAPTMGTSSAGRTYIEPKKQMKARGVPSPDRAESVLLTVYEPGTSKRKKKARLIV